MKKEINLALNKIHDIDLELTELFTEEVQEKLKHKVIPDGNFGNSAKWRYQTLLKSLTTAKKCLKDINSVLKRGE